MPVPAIANKLLNSQSRALLAAHFHLSSSTFSQVEAPGINLPQNCLILPLVCPTSLVTTFFLLISFPLDTLWEEGLTPADLRQADGEVMAKAFLEYISRNPCCNIMRSLHQVTTLIEDSSKNILRDHHLLDTLKHAYRELITTATSIAGGSEGQ